MEQLTQLVERMSARFVILETQLKLVQTYQPREQGSPPPTSLPPLNTPPPHDIHITKKAEVALSPHAHHQTTSHLLSPPQLVQSQAGADTPAKMGTQLKSPSSSPSSSPSPSPSPDDALSTNCTNISTPLNTWTVHNSFGDPLMLSSFHSAADDQLRRKMQPAICSKSPAKLSSVHQMSGFCFTPTTPVRALLVVE